MMGDGKEIHVYETLLEAIKEMSNRLADTNKTIMKLATEVATSTAVAKEKEKRCEDHERANQKLETELKELKDSHTKLEKEISEWKGAKGLLVWLLTMIFPAAINYFHK